MSPSHFKSYFKILLFVLVISVYIFVNISKSKEKIQLDIDMLNIEKGFFINDSGFVKIRKEEEAKTFSLSGKTIIIWTTLFGESKRIDSEYNLKLPQVCQKCEITTNRSKPGDAIVIYNNWHTLESLDLPDKRFRTPNQYYVFRTRETPAKTIIYGDMLKHPDVDGIFNLTWYFRHDSDVLHEFGSVKEAVRMSKVKKLDDFKKLMKNKEGLVVWAVSNCDNTKGATERLKYANKLLQSGLRLKAIGKCFEKGQKMTEKEYIDFSKYKFYLAFENSIKCPDYITEKFWINSLNEGLVPIVFGPIKSDVTKIAPKYSFIHTDDFKKPEDLVKYLNYLDKNDTAYLEYHQWRKVPYNEPKKWTTKRKYMELCELCKLISKRPPQHKTIPSIYDWMYNEKYYQSSQCLLK